MKFKASRGVLVSTGKERISRSRMERRDTSEDVRVGVVTGEGREEEETSCGIATR